MKKSGLILIISCFLAAVGCTDKTTVSDSSAEATTQVTTVITTTAASSQETTEPYEIPKLSKEIPAEAVTKSTFIKIENDNIKFHRIEYLNEHGDYLMTIDVDPESGFETVMNNVNYEYDDKGNKIYKDCITQSYGHYSESKYYYEYDENGNNISIVEIQNGKKYHTEEMIYDEYNNLISRTWTLYNDDGETIDHQSTTSKSDLSYDKFGNLISFKYYEDGDFSYSSKCTYNAEHLLSKEKLTWQNGWIDYYRYQYVPNTDTIALIENSSESNGEITVQQTEKLEYDDKMRMTLRTVDRTDRHESFEYTYEDFK